MLITMVKDLIQSEEGGDFKNVQMKDLCRKVFRTREKDGGVRSRATHYVEFIFQLSLSPNWPSVNQILYQLFIIDLIPHYNTLVSNTEVPHISGEDIPFDDVRKIFILH